MRIITLNANGIRAAARKGFFRWLPRQSADVVCIQETKAQEHQLTDKAFRPVRYHCFYEDAEKKGYSGVAVFSRLEPDDVVRGFGSAEFDAEGRYSLRLASGTYELSASAPCYGTQAVTGIEVTGGAVSTLDLVLVPLNCVYLPLTARNTTEP